MERSASRAKEKARRSLRESSGGGSAARGWRRLRRRCVTPGASPSSDMPPVLEKFHASRISARPARCNGFFPRPALVESEILESPFFAPRSSCPSSSLGTHLSAKLRFLGMGRLGALLPDAGPRKQSFQDKCMTKLELGHEGTTLVIKAMIPTTLGTSARAARPSQREGERTGQSVHLALGIS